MPISAVRMYVEKVQQVRILRRTADKIMEECREIILRQYVTNLWSRYRVHTRKQEPRPTFAAWLNGKRTEDTYTWEGHQFSTRQMWSARPIKEASRPENNPEGEISIDWFIEGLELRLNNKQRIQLHQPVIGIRQIVTQSVKHPASPSFEFYVYNNYDEEDANEG